MKENLKIAEKNILRKSKEAEGTEIHGPDFNKVISLDSLLDSLKSTGFQASKLHEAVQIIREMRKKHCTIYLGFTSNMVTSGLRDVFKFLAQHKLVDVIVTTAGGVEEDFIKCFHPFILGEFEASGKLLRQKGINRTGNIFVPNSRYVEFEKFFIPCLEEAYRIQEKTGKIWNPSELTELLASRLEKNKEDSIYYWCWKNKIPVFCPAITDGSMGDMIYFYKYQQSKFKIDITDDIKKLHDMTIEAKKTGIIILGSGMIKHHICNSNMFRNGADYAVYINNSQEFDGSDSGARPDEAVSWGKIKSSAKSVKVFGDATILFPLIVKKAFDLK
ncbi:putative deoxyhypusine synthase [uncultured archaeon]|nr:putative deoxyhypusine synthase [uncultured archaeon]